MLDFRKSCQGGMCSVTIIRQSSARLEQPSFKTGPVFAHMASGSLVSGSNLRKAVVLPARPGTCACRIFEAYLHYKP